jgi:hypothetical protein
MHLSRDPSYLRIAVQIFNKTREDRERIMEN